MSKYHKDHTSRYASKGIGTDINWPKPGYSKEKLTKGNIAEQCVLRYLQGLGDCLIEYHEGKPHKIDFTVTEDASTMPYRYHIDVKGIEERREFSCYGFNEYQYRNYKQLECDSGIPVKVYFVDWSARVCMGNDLDILEQHHEQILSKAKVQTFPHRIQGQKMPTGESRDMINFPTVYLKAIFDLLDEEVEALRDASIKVKYNVVNHD